MYGNSQVAKKYSSIYVLYFKYISSLIRKNYTNIIMPIVNMTRSFTMIEVFCHNGVPRKTICAALTNDTSIIFFDPTWIKLPICMYLKKNNT